MVDDGGLSAELRLDDVSSLPRLVEPRLQRTVQAQDRENQQRGGYHVYFDPSDQGTDVAPWFTMSYEADLEITRWITNTDFRRALSLGIDRNQLNATFWLGLGVPSAVLPGENILQSPGPEYCLRWVTYTARHD